MLLEETKAEGIVADKNGFEHGKLFTNDAEGKGHLDHVLRVPGRFDSNKIPQPKFEVIGDIHAITEQPEPLRKRTAKNKTSYNYFHEFQSYAGTPEEIRESIEYLRMKTGHDVVAVLHLDESLPHTHFLVPWIGQDKRSLRMAKGDLMAIRNNLIRIAGRSVAAPGQGRHLIGTKRYMADARGSGRNRGHDSEIAAPARQDAEMIRILWTYRD